LTHAPEDTVAGDILLTTDKCGRSI